MESNQQEEDNRLSFENQMFVDAIMRVLNDYFEKLKISLILPNLLEDTAVLAQHMDLNEYQNFLTLCSSYTMGLKRASRLSTKRAETMKDLWLIEIIDHFHQNSDLIKALPQELTTLDSNDLEFVKTFESLLRIAEQRLNMTAASELLNEKKIFQHYHENQRVIKNIADLMDKIGRQDVNARWKIKAKQALVKKYEIDLATARWENNVKIKREISKSNLRLREKFTQSKFHQKALSEELEKVHSAYDQTLKTNLKGEKELRDEKNKLLLQFQSILRKYDENIGEKSQENMELQIVYDEEKRKFDEFMIIFEREEDAYNDIVLRKTQEMEKERLERQMMFMLNRAARIIQLAWRAYMNKKKKEEAKKDKQKKGKKK